MRYIARLVLPALLLVYISVETYFKLHHTSICAAEGCKLAGELLRFNAIYLNFFGIAAALTLLIVGGLSLKKPSLEKIFGALLFGAIAFEGTLFGFQWFSNPEPCLFCAGVFAQLLLIALLARPKEALSAVAIAIAVFSAYALLAVPKNSPTMQKDGDYLIFSAHCPHCKKVKAYLADTRTPYTPIPVTDPTVRYVLKFAGIGIIPVWIEKEGETLRWYAGDRNIIAHLKKRTASEISPAVSESTESGTSSLPSSIGMGNGFLQAGAEDEGCTLSINEPSPCEENLSGGTSP